MRPSNPARSVRFLWIFVLLIVVGMMLLPYAAYGRGGPPDHSQGRPPVSPPVGPPLSPPVGPPLSTPVCHLNDLGEWQVISVSTMGKALEAHLAHGDAMPGEEVPGMAGYAFDDDCLPVAIPVLTFTPVEWFVLLNDPGWGPGIHTIFTIVEVRPLTVDEVEDLFGRLVWDETLVDLCNIEVRQVGDGFLHIGDGYQTIEGCGSNPTAMQDAFDEFGLPETACVGVRSGGIEHEYCAPLDVIE